MALCSGLQRLWCRRESVMMNLFSSKGELMMKEVGGG